MGQTSSTEWENEINCERLCSYPDVRAFIASQRCNKNYMSAEEFLEHYDTVVMGGVFGLPGGISSFGADLGHALAARLHIKTGKEREVTIQRPCGKVLVAILSHLVRENIELDSTEQFSEACLLTCTIPSSISTYKGDLKIGVGRRGSSTVVVASATFSGQMFDWGRANRILNDLFQAARNGVRI